MLWGLCRREVFGGWAGVLRELCRGVLLRFDRGNIRNDLRGLWRGYLLHDDRGDCADDLPRLRSWLVFGSCRCSGFIHLLGLPLGIIRSNDRSHELHELPRRPIRRCRSRGLRELRSGHVPDELHFGELHGLRCRKLQPRNGTVGVFCMRRRIFLLEHRAPCKHFVLYLRRGLLPDDRMLSQREHGVLGLPRRKLLHGRQC